jgi:nitrogenase molybdenum-iron protein alpha/beta subunit
MNSKTSLSNTCRYGGCTLTGALAVTAFVPDGISIIHGPSGCAHHHVSLLHSTLMQYEILPMPRIMTTGLGEREVIFGGEESLEETIAAAIERSPNAVFVISTCVTGTIGDDTEGICRREWSIPVIPIDCAGFLGGTFSDGFSRALTSLSTLIDEGSAEGEGVNIVGERNLEVEVEENFCEVYRILKALDIPVNVRFVRNTPASGLGRFAGGNVNLFREDPDGALSRFFTEKYRIPGIGGFPIGPAGSCRLIRRLGGMFGRDTMDVIREEKAQWQELAADFSDLRGGRITLQPPATAGEWADAVSLASCIGCTITDAGIPVPWNGPIGIGGARRMLRIWRRRMYA